MDIPLILSSAIALQDFSIYNVVTLLIIIGLLMISAFVSSSEVAFFSLTPQQLSDMHEADTEADRRVFELQKQSEYLLATILIVNNFVNVAIVVLTAYLIDSAFVFAPWLEFVVQTIIIAFLLLLFGEIMPKMYAQNNAVKSVRRASGTFRVLVKILRPLAALLVRPTRHINKLSKLRHDNLSIDQLNDALELTSGSESTEEQEILKGIANFGTTTVNDVMTTRLDMVTVNLGMPFGKVLEVVEQNGYSRIPVVQTSQDDIRGVLYIKDLLPHLNKGNNFRWQTLIRQAYFVPENKKLDDLLREFQKNKIHVAIVVDEFGGTLGMVTMEDVLEEVVGDISDEYDDDERLFTKIDEQNWLFEAKILLNDFFKATDIDEADFGRYTEEVDTLAGLLLELKGDFPKQGEKISHGRYTFEIVAMNKRRIEKVKLKIS